MISVILPTYNRAYILPRAIKSVLNQTFKDFELIIIDDGSTDNTKEVVKSFKDSRIRYIKHEQNKGLSASRNTGIKAAKYDLIANQDSDDEWLPDKLKHEQAVLEYLEVDFVFSRIEKEKNGKKFCVPDDWFNSKNLHQQLLSGNFITMQATLVKKKCFEEGFDESLPALQDWDFWLRASKKYRYAYWPYVTVKVKVLKDSITQNKGKRLRAREMIYQKYGEIPQVALSLGRAFALRGEKKAYKYLCQAVRHNPLHLPYLLLYLIGFYK